LKSRMEGKRESRRPANPLLGGEGGKEEKRGATQEGKKRNLFIRRKKKIEGQEKRGGEAPLSAAVGGGGGGGKKKLWGRSFAESGEEGKGHFRRFPYSPLGKKKAAGQHLGEKKKKKAC